MNCPVCNKTMTKKRWEVTNNLKAGINFNEYDHTTFQCLSDDVWVTTEIPLAEKKNT